MRTKHVFKANELVHIWANQGQDEGWIATRNLRFEGQTLRSHGTALGVIDGDTAYITDTWFSSRGFGDARNGYVSAAVCACRHKTVVRLPHQYIAKIARGLTATPPESRRGLAIEIRRGLIKDTLDECREVRGKVGKAKSRRYYILTTIRDQVSALEATLAALTRLDNSALEELPAELTSLVPSQEELDTARAYSAKWEAVDAERVKKHGAFGRESWEKRRERWKRREREALFSQRVNRVQWEEKIKAFDTQLEDWRTPWSDRAVLPRELTAIVVPDEMLADGTYNDVDKLMALPVSRYYGALVPVDGVQYAMLTLRNATSPYNPAHVLTSQGATVPIHQAVKLYKLILAVRERGEDYTPATEFRVGYYPLAKISAGGDIEVGCHRIKWEEIERVAGPMMEYYAARQEELTDTTEKES